MRAGPVEPRTIKFHRQVEILRIGMLAVDHGENRSRRGGLCRCRPDGWWSAAGSVIRAISTSSNPTMETSSGTRAPPLAQPRDDCGGILVAADADAQDRPLSGQLPPQRNAAFGL